MRCGSRTASNTTKLFVMVGGPVWLHLLVLFCGHLGSVHAICDRMPHFKGGYEYLDYDTAPVNPIVYKSEKHMSYVILKLPDLVKSEIYCVYGEYDDNSMAECNWERTMYNNPKRCVNYPPEIPYCKKEGEGDPFRTYRSKKSAVIFVAFKDFCYEMKDGILDLRSTSGRRTLWYGGASECKNFCPEISRKIETNFGATPSLVIDEKHDTSYSDLNSTLMQVEENSDITLTMYAHICDKMEIRMLRFYQTKDGLRFRNIKPSMQAKSYPKDRKTYEDFTERITMAEKSGRNNINTIGFRTGHIGLNDRYLIILATSGNIADMEKDIQKLITEWHRGNYSSNFTTVIKKPTTSVRAIKFVMFYDTIQKLGKKKIFHYSGLTSSAQVNCTRTCEGHTKSVDDITVLDGGVQLILKDIVYSGNYTCKEDGVPLFEDVPVVVLPDDKDILIRVKYSDESDVVSDGKNDYYVRDPLLLTCSYNFSKCLHSTDQNGLYLKGDYQKTGVSSETDEVGLTKIMSVTYKVTKFSEEDSYCFYKYQKTTQIQQITEVDHEVKSRRIRLHPYNAKPPHFFSYGVNTSSKPLTTALRAIEGENVTTHAKVNESWITGEFEAAISEKYSLGSIWLVVKDENKERSRVDCHSILEKIGEKAQGQISVRYKFGCPVTVSAVEMVFSLYDTGTYLVSVHDVEKKYTKYIVKDKGDEPTFMPPVKRFLARVHLDVRWRATIKAGDSVLMLCHKDADTVDKYGVGCQFCEKDDYKDYGPERIYDKWVTISEIPGQRLFSLKGHSAVETYSGIHRCFFTSKLSKKQWRGRPRVLIVLNGLDRTRIWYKTKKSQKLIAERRQNSLEKPLFIDETEEFTVWCVYWFNIRLSASTSVTVAHESYNEQHTYIAHATEKGKVGEIDKEWFGSYVSTEFTLKIPEYYDYHNHSKFTCVLKLWNLKRDSADVLENFTEYTLNDTRYVRYPLKPIEGNIFNITFTKQFPGEEFSVKRVESDLRDNKTDAKRYVIQEGLYELNYTVFLGHPRGKAKLWIIRRSSSGKYVIDRLANSSLGTFQCVTPPRGICERHWARFVLQITDVGLVILLVRPKIAENGNVDHTENEEGISRMLMEAFRLGWKDDVVKIQARNLALLKMVHIQTCWPAVVNVGGNFTIYGRGNRTDCIHARLRNTTDTQWVTGHKITGFGGFEISTIGVSIADSGFYWCNANVTHELVVIPDKDQVEIHLDSSDAFSDQTILVKCVYNTTGLEYLKPDVSLRTDKGKVGEPSPSSEEPTWIYKVTTQYNFTAPGPKDFGEGKVNLTCHFAYRNIAPPDCCREKEDFSLNQTKQISIKLRASPKIFQLTTIPKGIVNRLEYALKDPMSATDFERTACDTRRNESRVKGSVILNLGSPRGNFSIYLLRTYGGEMHEFNCTYTIENIPDYKQPEYKEAHGKNFVNASFTCIVQAEHEAMVFLVYSTNECSDSCELVESKIRDSIKKNVGSWTNNPGSERPLKFTIPYGVLVATAVFKLKFGYPGSVRENTSWSMLAIGNNMNCYKQINDGDEYGVIELEKISGDNTYSMLGKKHANYSDSGYYTCGDSRTSGFSKRKLIVLPAESMMNIYLKENEEFTDAYSRIDEYGAYYVYYNKSFGVRCNFPKSQMVDLKPSVNLVYNRRGQKGPNPRQLAEGDDYVDFWVTAPFPHNRPKKLTVKCVVKYAKLESTEFDTGKSSVKRYFEKSRDMVLRPRNCPKLFKDGIFSNVRNIFERIGSGMKDRMKAEDFEKTSSPKLIPEGLVNVSMFQDLGQPYGTPSLYVFRKAGRDLFPRKCTGVVTRNITTGQGLPSKLLWKEFNANPFRNFVKTFFTCIVRTDDEVMAFVTHSKICRLSDDEVENKLVDSIKNNLREWDENPSVAQEVKLPPDVFAKFAIIKLNMGYHATVNISEPWSITGILPTGISTLQCYYSSDQKTYKPLDVSQMVIEKPDGYFLFGKSNASYDDSGYYLCNSSNKNDSEAGFHERKLLVLPKNDTLSIELTSEGRLFTQSYLYSDQELTVECKFPTPNLPILRYQLGIEYKVIDKEKKAVCFSFKNRLSKYTISPPKVNGNIELACLVTEIRAEAIEHDLSPLKDPINLYQEKKIQLEMVDPPEIFPQYNDSNRPEFFNRIYRSSVNRISRREFHTSSPINRVTEGIVNISMIQNLGIPKGCSSMYLFHGPWANLTERKCGDAEWTNLPKSRIPRELQRTESYRTTHGASFGNASFSCLVQAENVAMLFLVFSKTKTNKTDETIEKELINATKRLIKDLAEKPEEEDDKKSLDLPKDVHVAFLIVKLNVGFSGSVHLSRPWKMLGLSPENRSSLQCYKGSEILDLNSPKENITMDYQYGYFEFGKKSAEYLDSAYYTCNSSNTSDPDAGFQTRKLLVLPDASLMDIHLSTEHLNCSDISSFDLNQWDGNKSFVYSGQEISHRLLYRKPTNVMPDVSVSLDYTYTKKKPTTEGGGDHRPNRNCSNETHITQEYLLLAPGAKESDGPINIRFILKYENVTGDEHDITPPPKTITVSKSMEILIHVLARPYLFLQHLSDLVLFEKISGGWTTKSEGNETIEEFNNSQSDTIFLENVVCISDIQNLGLPRGRSYAYVFHEERSMFPQQCTSVGETDLQKPELDKLQEGNNVEVPLQDVRSLTSDQNFVNKTFECVIQAEHYAIAFFIIANRSTRSADKIMNETLENIQSALKSWRAGENQTYTRYIDAKDMFMTSVIIKLNVGWKASVHLGMPWMMLTHTGEKEASKVKPKLYHKKTETTLVPTAGHFSIYFTKNESDFKDSGDYSCNFQNYSSPCFENRRLFIRPTSVILTTYICHRRYETIEILETSCETYKVGTPVMMINGLTKFLYFVYNSPEEEFEVEKFTYTTLEGEDVKGVTPLGKSRHNSTVMSSYSVRGHAFEQTDTNFTLILTYSDTKLDKKDVSRNIKIDPISVSIIFTFDLLIPPHIYVTSLKANDVSLKRGLRESLRRTNEPLNFHELQEVMLKNEGMFEVAVIFAIGEPKGKISMKAIYEHQGKLSDNLCRLVRLQGLKKKPGNLKCKKIHKKMLFNATFRCVLRQEHEVFSVLAFNFLGRKYTDEEKRAKEDEMKESVLVWVGDVKEDKTRREWSGATGTTVDMRIARMKIGWNQRVLSGSSVKMLGYLGEKTIEEVECYFNSTKVDASKWRVVLKEPDAFYLTNQMTDCSDSGEYYCKVIDELGYKVGFVSRFLVVKPDSSKINLSLSEQWFDNRVWMDSWDKRDHGEPYIYTHSSIYAGCASTCVYDSRWEYSEKLIFSPGLKVDGEFYLSPTSLRYQHRVSIEATTARTLNLTCEFTYSVPKFGSLFLRETRVLAIKQIVPPKLRMNESYVRGRIVEELQTPIEIGRYFRDHHLNLTESVISLNLSVQLGTPTGWTRAWTFISYNKRLIRESCMIVSILSRNPPAEQKSTGNITNVVYECVLKPETVGLALTVSNIIENRTNQSTVDKTLHNLLKVGFENLTMGNNVTKKSLKSDAGSLFDYRMIGVDVSAVSSLATGSTIKFLGYSYNVDRSTIHCSYKWDPREENAPVDDSFRIIPRLNGLGFRLMKPKAEFRDAGWYLCNITHDQVGGTSYIGFVSRHLWVIPDTSVLKLEINHMDIDVARSESYGNFTQYKRNNVPFLLCDQPAFLYCTFPALATTRLKHEVQALLDSKHRLPRTLHLRTLQVGSSRSAMRTEVYQITAPNVNQTFRYINVTCTVNYTFTDKTTSLSVSKTIWIDRRVEPYIFLPSMKTPNRPEIAEVFLNRTKKPIETAHSFYSSWPVNRALEGLVKLEYVAGLGIPRGDTEVSLFYRVKRVIKRAECVNIKIINITHIDIELKNTSYFKKTNGANIVNATAICQLTPAISAMMITAINTFDDSRSIKVVKRKFYRDASRVFRKWFDDPTSYTTTRLTAPEKSGLFQRSIRIDVGWRASVPSGSTVSMFGRVIGRPSCTLNTTKVSGIVVRKKTFSSFEFIRHNVSEDSAGLYHCRVESTEMYKSFSDQRLLVVFDKSIPLSQRFYSLRTTESDSLENHHSIVSEEYLYQGQAISAQCKYRTDHGSVPYPPIYLEWEPRNISASPPVCNRSIDGLDEKSIICSAKIRISDETMGSRLNVTCKLYYGYNESRYDVNCQYNNSFYQSARSFKLKSRIHPRIESGSFNSSSSDLKGALNNLTRSDVVLPYQIGEGQVELNYSVNLGDPPGWTSVILVFNHSGVLVFDECSKIIANTNVTNVSYKCLLQPQHVGIFVHATHIFSGGRTETEANEDIMEILRRQFMNVTSGRKMITLPEDCDGDNLLDKINVVWNASVKIKDPVRMIGQLGNSSKGKPMCYYGSGKKKENLTDKGFTVNMMNGFFEILKDKIHYEDSGLYSCELTDCEGCPDHLGLAERELLVLPDETIIDLREEEEDIFDENLRDCDNPGDIFTPGQKVSVYCRYELTWRLASIGSGLLLFDECKRLESGRHIAEAANVRTVETWDEYGMKTVEKSLTSQLPEKHLDWCAQCRLDFNTTKLLYDQRPEVPPIRTFNREKKHKIRNVRRPKIQKSTITSSPVREVGDLLQDDYFSSPSLGVFDQSHASPLIKEGPLNISLSVDLGEPQGSLRAYVKIKNELTDDYCHISASRILCLLLPQHEALVIGVVNEPRTTETLRDDLTYWLNHRSSESPESKCYYSDIRIVQLKVGWNATLWAGENATFYGRLKNSNDSVTCSKSSYSSDHNETISDSDKQFSYSNISISAKLIQFALTITGVKTVNTGIYNCKTDNWSVLEGHDLQVLPRTVNLTITVGPDKDNQFQLMSKKPANVSCKHDPIIGFGVNDSLLYQMRNSQTDEMVDVAYNYTELLNVGEGGVNYTIVPVQAKDYVGPVRISCLTILTLRNISNDISAHLGAEVLSASINVTILEPANGDIVIRTVATDYETQPVPLGSEFTCTGGYGLPPLEYKWTCQSMNDNGSFSDGPKESLVVRGVYLIVPDEDSFRGTRYTCTCEGYNTVLDKKHTITKTINITVLLCLTDEVEMDLTIVVNPCILRNCRIFFPRYEEMLAQVIMSLPNKYGRVRFQFVTINTDEKDKLPNTFDHNQIGEQLVDKLKALQETCTLTGGLDKVIEELENADKPVAGRNYIVLLPVDNETMKHTLETSTLMRLNSSGVKFLTGFTHKTSGKLELQTKRFIGDLNPIKWSQLLPEYEYGECEDSKLRIYRKDLYDALCYSGGYKEPGTVDKPVMQFIPSLERLYTGINLVVICAVPALTLEHEIRHIEISLCLTNETKLHELSRYKRLNIQILRRTCNVPLTEKTVRGPLKKLAVTERVKLPRDDSNSYVLCYQRRGGHSPKVYDPTNYTQRIFKVNDKIFGKPELSIIQRPCGAERSARLKCKVQCNIANLRALLVAEYPTLKKETHLFVVIARSEFSSPFLNLQMEANLNWVQTPENITDITVYCVAMPVWKDDLKQTYASLWKDREGALVRVSKEQHLNMSANRPSAPEMKIEPNFQQNHLKLGSRLEITCEANTTSEGLPLQLMYLTTNYTIILCTNGTLTPMLTPRYTPVPCIYLTPSAAEDCSQFPADLTKTDNTYYPAVCSLYFSSELKIYVRQIRLVVTKLRMVDFGARVFCKTLDPFVKSVPSDKPRDLLYTEVEEVRYRITPYIEDFHFDQSREEWYCSAVGFPHSDEGSIEEVSAKPGWLKAQLSRFVSSLLDPKLSILNKQLLPLGTKNPKYRGQFDLVFRSPHEFPEGLTKGLAIVQCNFSGQIVRLETRTGKKPFVEEPLISDKGVIRAQQPVRLQCWMDLAPNTTIDRIAFHRTVHYFWMKYDVTLLSISPADVSKQLIDRAGDQKGVHLSGLWAISSVPAIRVLYEVRERSVGVEIVNIFSTEFDSGQYYCTAYAMGKFLKARSTAVSVLGISKNITFGCRTLTNYTLWKPQLIKLNPGDIYHTVCMVWSTDPYDRVIDRLLLENSERQMDSNLTVEILQHPSRLVLGKAQQYQLIELERPTDALTCLLEHHSTVKRSTISSSKVECSMPDLTWTPKDQLIYSNKEVITCVVRSSCLQPYITWQWLAGPIPQLTLSADEVQAQTISESDRLYLSRLPRGGTYLFSCSATCVCASGTYTNSIDVQLFLDDSDIESDLELEDPDHCEPEEESEVVNRDLTEVAREIDSLEEETRRTEKFERIGKKPTKSELDEDELKKLTAVEGVDIREDARLYPHETRPRSESEEWISPKTPEEQIRAKIRPPHMPSDFREGYSPVTDVGDRPELDEDTVGKKVKERLNLALTSYLREDQLLSPTDGLSAEGELGGLDTRRSSAFGELLGGYGVQRRPSHIKYAADARKQFGENADVFGLSEVERHAIEKGQVGEEVASLALVNYARQMEQFKDRVIFGLPRRSEPSVTNYEVTDPFVDMEQVRRPGYLPHSAYSDEEFALAIRDRLKVDGASVGTTSSGAFRPSVSPPDVFIGRGRQRLYDIHREASLHAASGEDIDESFVARYGAISRRDRLHYKAVGGAASFRGRATDTFPTDAERRLLSLEANESSALIRIGRDKLSPRLTSQGEIRPSVKERKGELFAYDRNDEEPIPSYGADSGISGWDDDEKIPASLAKAIRLHAIRKDVGPHTRLVPHQERFSGLFDGTRYTSDQASRDTLKYHTKTEALKDMFGAKGPLVEDSSEQVGERSRSLDVVSFLDETIKPLTSKRRLLPSISWNFDRKEDKAQEPSTDVFDGSKASMNLLQRFGDYYGGNRTISGDGEKGRELKLDSEKDKLTRSLDRPYAKYEELPAAVLRLRDQTVGTEALSDETRNMQWTFDSRTQMETSVGDERSGALSEDYRSWLKRMDIVKKLSDSNYPVKPSTGTKSQTTHSVAPFSGTKTLTSTGDLWKENMNAGQSASWMRPVAKLINVLNRDFGMEFENTSKMQVVLTPNVLQLPGTTTARCPNIEKSFKRGYQPSYITWLHIPGSNDPHSAEKEEIIRFSLIKREIKKLSTRDRLHNRTFIFPPKKWSDSSTLDITELVPADCGYYACSISFGSHTDRSPTINITKVSNTPLCIVPALREPSISVVRMKGRMGQDNPDDVKGTNSSCYYAGDQIIIRCDATAHQLFCERSDYMLHGYRIIETELEVKVTRVQRGRLETLLAMNALAPNLRNVTLTIPGDLMSVSSQWRATIHPNFNDAFLNCIAKPKLVVPNSGVPPYWNHLVKDFHRHYNHVLRRRSQSLRLCVSHAEQELFIHPGPSIGRTDQTERATTHILRLWPNQIITCDVIKRYKQPPVLKFFRIMNDKVDVARKLGMDGLPLWHDVKMQPVQWINITEQKRTRVMIPPQKDSIGHFFVLCDIDQTNVTESLILQVVRDRGVHIVPLDISNGVACLVLGLILVLLYLMKHSWRRIRGTRSYFGKL